MAPAPPPVTAEPEPAPPEAQLDIEIECAALDGWLNDGKELVLLDIREPHELQHGVARGALLIRMNDLPSRLEELPLLDTRMVVYCAAGGRSFSVTGWLREQGWTDVWSLSGGYFDYLKIGGEAVSWPLVVAPMGCELADLKTIQATIRESGHSLLVNHWATWCEGCVEELPLLVKLHKEFGETVEFVGISWEGFQGEAPGAAQVQAVERFSQEHGLAWRSLIVDAEPEALFEALDMQCQTVPQVWLVDASGSVVHRIEGALDEAGLGQLRTQIKALQSAM